MEQDIKKPVLVVVGGQYGSESKGLVTAHLALERKADIAVRTGSINAGHTVYYRGKKYVNQLLPVAWVNPDTTLVLGAGCYIEKETLEKEVEMINEAIGDGSDVRKRILIDNQCGIHTQASINKEKESGLHARMGSTAHGVMEAIIDKMQRPNDRHTIAQTDADLVSHYQLVDTCKFLNGAYDSGLQIIIEGTQGALLDFHYGHYPFVTTRQTNASAWLMEAGLSPKVKTEIVMVLRTFPIRVAGNSGPMGDREIKWVDLARSINRKIEENVRLVARENLSDDQKLAKNRLAHNIVNENLISEFEARERRYLKDAGINLPDYELWTAEQRELYAQVLSDLHKAVIESFDTLEQADLKKFFEFTTVTKKLRRIADFDTNEVKKAIMLNRPDSICLNFLNYRFPSCWGASSIVELHDCIEHLQIEDTLLEMEEELGTPINYVNCAPDSIIKIK